MSLYEEEPTSNNPLKPFDNPPRSSTDLSKNYNDDEDSFRVVFEQPSDDEVSESDAKCQISDIKRQTSDKKR